MKGKTIALIISSIFASCAFFSFVITGIDDFTFTTAMLILAWIPVYVMLYFVIMGWIDE